MDITRRQVIRGAAVVPVGVAAVVIGIKAAKANPLKGFQEGQVYRFVGARQNSGPALTEQQLKNVLCECWGNSAAPDVMPISQHAKKIMDGLI